MSITSLLEIQITCLRDLLMAQKLVIQNLNETIKCGITSDYEVTNR